MSLVWLVVGLALIVVGLAGLLLPMLPGMPLVFLGAVAVAAADGFTRVGYAALAIIALLAIVASVLDHIAGVLGAKRGGASKWGMAGAVVGLLVGLPFGLPGLVLGPAVGAAILEFARDRELRRAARASTGVFIGFVLGTIVKYAIACAILGILVLAYAL
jgi:uncharacterized protein YqgC (DUF456 family)